VAKKKHHEHFISPPVTTVNGRPNNSNNFNHWVLRNTELTQCRPYVVNRPRPTQFVYRAFDQSGSAVFGASLLKFVLFEMYNYLINFRPVLLGAPLQLDALSARLVRLWVNPAQTPPSYPTSPGAPLTDPTLPSACLDNWIHCAAVHENGGQGTV